MRYAARAELIALFDGRELLLSPTTCVVAPRTSEEVVREPLIAFTNFCNLTGLPAATVPCGRVDGLPVGLHVIGRPGADDLVLRACRAFELLHPIAASVSALDGAVAVVTGAASGIGRAVAELFAAEGASVVAVDRAPGVVDDRPAAAADAVVCDVRDADGIAGVAERVERRLGRWDILVNAAGAVAHGEAGETTEEDWGSRLRRHARGTWLDVPRGARRDGARRSGAIVNIASGAGLRPLEGIAAYAASKAAAISLTRSIALEYGADGIRANCICPGIVDTPLKPAALAELAPDTPRWPACSARTH